MGVRIFNPQGAQIRRLRENGCTVCVLLDMVVSVQTALVHLCGALERPVWRSCRRSRNGVIRKRRNDAVVPIGARVAPGTRVDSGAH
jgi:hypothetical protein